MTGPDDARRLGHELRTPLNAILGFSTLLQRDDNLTPRQVERLATIEAAGRELLTRIDALLAGDAHAPPPLPVAQAPLADTRAPAASTPRAAGAAATILAIDDTPANVDLLVELLGRNALRAITACDGESGLAAARLHLPDLILLDVQMPGMDGFEVCRALKQDPATAGIPVIFMTVIADTAAKVAAFEAGAVDYVTKPFHVDEALARVNTQLTLLQGQRELARMNEELEARVQDRTRQLAAANRELQSICHAMAHDLRGPIGSLDGFSRLLEEMLAGQGDARARHYLARIRSGVRQMDGLTDAMLLLAHLTLREHHRETVDLGGLAADFLQARITEEPHRQVELDIEPGMVVQADRALMKLVVEHLVGNAWKFTLGRPLAQIAFRSAPDAGGGRSFVVSDNGAGFDPALADRLFQPFQRLHRAEEFPGLGIGLAIVDRIVRSCGGRAWAQAAPGQGAAFYFTLG